MKPMTILQAMQDARIFGKTFRRNWRGADTWKAWRAFLAALFGLPLTGEALGTYRAHTGRSVAPRDAFREAWAICGRRSGKSLIAATVAVFLACFRDYSAYRAPGETLVLPIIAPDRRQCRTILGYVNGFLDSSPALRSLVAERLKESVLLRTGVRIEVATANFRTVRGYTAIGAIIDEAAFLRSDDSSNPDTELLAALRPAMSTIPNALLLAISSPYSRKGELWRAYKENFGKDDSEVLIWKAASREMNPTLSRAVVAAAYLRDSASARAEYGGEFREDVEDFLSLELVEACTVAGRVELPYDSQRTYTAFVDPSGGRSDSMTLAVAHRSDETAVLDVLREVQPPFSPEEVVREFADVLKSYGISEVTGDRYAGEWVSSAFAKCGIEYTPSAQTRSELYLSALPLLTSGRVKLLDNKRLVNQLTSLERRATRGGRDSVDHPPSGHDDLSNAATGVLTLVLGDSQTYGLLDWVRDGGPFRLKHRRAPEPSPAEEVAALRRRLRLQRIEEPAAKPEAAIGPCPRCGATCRVRIGGAGIVCAQCGFQDMSDLPEVPRVSRADALSGRFGNITRRLR